jgi:hypothetical protein
MDCHNRPSHDYQTPFKFINDAITAGTIPKELPEIKLMALGVLAEEFPSTDSAMRYIESEISDYYESSYEDLYQNNKELIQQAIAGIQAEFKKNIFPEMKVNWKVYHNNIGHLEFNGCFRCHNDKHTTQQGRLISMDCNVCHSIIAQGVPDTIQIASVYDELEFVHPNDPDGEWKEYLCVECHADLY